MNERALATLVDKADLHIHFPEGGVGKDGPSGGVTLVVVLVSLLSQRRARADTAMTGEITLSGNVLPVGGIKQKVLAAYRHGIKRVILPYLNFKKDLQELPPSVRDAMEFVPVKHILEALQQALPSAGEDNNNNNNDTNNSNNSDDDKQLLAKLVPASKL